MDSFFKRIRILVDECQFTNPDEHIIDALIFGSSSKRTQSKLLEFDKTLTLNRALEIARTEEVTSSQMKSISSTQIDALKHSRKPHTNPSGLSIRMCGNCGTEHDISDRSSCPAYGTTCKACGKENHWKRVCRSKPAKKKIRRPGKEGRVKYPERPNGKQKQIGALTTGEMNPSGSLATPALDQLYFHTLSINEMLNSNTQALVQVQVDSSQGSKPLWCKVDTGAEGNVISVATYKKLHPTSPCNSKGVPMNLTPSNTVITAYGGHSISHFGTCVLSLSHEDHCKPYVFHVVDTVGPTILGLPTCTDLNLITLNYSITTQVEPESLSTRPSSSREGESSTAAKDILVKQYGDCFKGIGCFQGDFHITLDPSVPPVVHPPRRVPEALREPLKKELDSLVEQGIIAKVEQPTDWVNSLVCVTKSNGTLRICLDPKDLNHAIKRPHHFTPTLDDVLSQLNGAKWFSILDVRSGYWNIKLDEQSSLYTTFNSPYGRYRFLRLPFGLVCAQDIFQRKVDETFSGLDGVTGIADDIIVYGMDLSEHDKNLHAVMQRACETGLKFNQEKCQIKCKSTL